jgi:hypothetical protein
MSSRVVFPIAFRMPGPKGPNLVRSAEVAGVSQALAVGESRLRPAHCHSFSPCGWSAIGVESVLSGTAYLNRALRVLAEAGHAGGASKRRRSL